jgi:hypothetical protein
MSLATVASVVGIAGGVKNLLGSKKTAPGGGGTTDAAVQAADPFAGQRGYFGLETIGRYRDLDNFDPNEILNDPNYQFQLEQGLGAIDKGAAASGMLGSGTRLMDLQKFGSGLASNFADRQFNRKMSILQMLGGLSGATTGSPAAAAGAIQAGANNASAQSNYGLNSITSGLNGLSKVNWSGMWNGKAGGSAPGGLLWNDDGGWGK